MYYFIIYRSISRILYFPFFPEYEFTADVFLRLLIYFLETNLLFFFHLLYFLLERTNTPRAGHKHKNTKARATEGKQS